MGSGVHVLLILALVAVTSGALFADEPPLTPVELAKIGSIFASWKHPENISPGIQTSFNLPPQLTGISVLTNGIWHHFVPLPDGGLMFIQDGTEGEIFFRLDSHLQLRNSLLWRKSENKVLPVPDVPGGLRAEFLYWGHIAIWNTNKLPR